jgi:hypothetical protein
LTLLSNEIRFNKVCSAAMRKSVLLHESARGTFVWTGRALRAECDDLEMIGLALLYGAFVLLAIMDIRAHPISF